MNTYTLGEIAQLIGGTVEGQADTVIRGVARILDAGPGELSFVHDEKYLGQILTCQAGGLVVRDDLETGFRPLIRAKHPYYVFARVMGLFQINCAPPLGVHPASCIAGNAQLGRHVSIGPMCVIGEQTLIEDDALIWPSVRIGQGCRIGQGARIYPGAVLGDGVVVGGDCIIHSGCRLGSLDQPGFELGPPKVVLEARVEIGANGVVAPGLDTPTAIGAGSKIDNMLVMGPGACMGRDCLIVAQVTIGAGTVLGDRVTVAGQVCIQGGLTIGSRVMIAATSHVCDNIPDGGVYSGWPAKSHDFTQRIRPSLLRLPKLMERVKALS